jgi:hydroxyacylglutathione hydrolase
VVVDPGESEPVRRYLDAHDLDLAGILLTHHHGDHIGGVQALVADRPVPVYAPHDERIPLATMRMAEGERAELGSIAAAFEVLEIPGHTSTHIAYFGEGMLFCGDTLFAMGCGRVFDGTMAQLMRSLERIGALPPETRAYCGHEYTLANAAFACEFEADSEALQRRIADCRALRREGRATLPARLSDERATNPFLRLAHDSLRARVAERAGVDPADRPACFAALRTMKDGFRPPAGWVE